MNQATNEEEVVAEGRYVGSLEAPKHWLMGFLLNQMQLNVVVEPKKFLWMPRTELSNLDDSIKSFVA